MIKHRYASVYRLLCAVLVFTILFYGTILVVHGEEISDKYSIKIVQATLNEEGFECGTADGIVGNGTRAAVEEYQRVNGMAVTGVITDELADKLGLTAEILKGTLISDFVTRYNEGALYCNAISDKTGDPYISSIGEDIFNIELATLDDNASVLFLVDDRNLSVRGIILSKEGNNYNIPMVYEMVSSVYALDTSFTDVPSAVDFVGDFVINHHMKSGNMEYYIAQRDGLIYFIVEPIL